MRAATVLGVIVGGVTFGFTGFAFALFAISALALECPPAVVVPAVMLVGDTLILMLAWEQRASLLPPAAVQKLIMSVANVAAELRRAKPSRRTGDALQRKASYSA